MIRLAQQIDRMNQFLLAKLSWLIGVVVAIEFLIVLLRYGFSLGYIWLQELAIYSHALLFFCACAGVAARNGHVRVDILYKDMKPMNRARVNRWGTLLLLIPTVVLIGYHSAPYVLSSWETLEGSQDTGGLDLVFILKSFILVFCVLMALQGIAFFIRPTEGETHRE